MGRFAEFWFYFSVNKGAVIGLATLIFLVLVAILGPFIAPHAPYEQYREALLTPPAWQEGGNPSFLLGTDAVGRDLLSRLIYGARFSLFIGLIVVAISMVTAIRNSAVAKRCVGFSVHMLDVLQLPHCTTETLSYDGCSLQCCMCLCIGL